MPSTELRQVSAFIKEPARAGNVLVEGARLPHDHKADVAAFLASITSKMEGQIAEMFDSDIRSSHGPASNPYSAAAGYYFADQHGIASMPPDGHLAVTQQSTVSATPSLSVLDAAWSLGVHVEPIDPAYGDVPRDIFGFGSWVQQVEQQVEQQHEQQHEQQFHAGDDERQGCGLGAQ
ncbi:hypothetical protein O9K51_06155 [Purpureocillium lavendulum]|uniref:Uncharacterized protein n=1 Tax=Purpureocillium lavendulum TaxID=1247861 RepID=A0AB34FMH0_9HYPO|nr:hypothetical protein O9K51_06155 [Purpureocillium lavendulum]